MFELNSLKQTPTHYPVLDLIHNRWSPRAFSDKAIDQDDLNTLFDAATWTANCANEQPWMFIYAHKSNEEAFQKLLSCINPGNQVWAKNAAVLILPLARKTFQKNGQPNRYAMHDVGAATTTILLQAASMDIFGHVMGGFDIEKTIETFNLPNDIEPVSFVALGYLGDAKSLEEPFLSRETAPRSRRELREIVFENGLAE